MKPIKINIDKIQNNPDNPRVIKDYKFDKLVKSITEFPEMLLGGNMRYKAAVKAGLKEVYAIQAEDLTDKQKQEFVIKDNSNFGEWDWDILANEWDVNELSEWGLDVPIINEKLEVIGDEKPEIEITEEILEEHNYIVFTFDNQLDWQVAKDLLNIKTVAKAGYTDTYMQKGVGRVKKGKDLLKLLNGL